MYILTKFEKSIFTSKVQMHIFFYIAPLQQKLLLRCKVIRTYFAVNDLLLILFPSKTSDMHMYTNYFSFVVNFT